MRAVLVVSACLLLSGCAVFEVASTAVDVTTTAVSTTVTVVGAVITAPFPDAHSNKKSKED